MILRDYLRKDLDVVFCGTAAGDRSAARGHFYAGPGNKFWRMLHETGLTDARFAPEHDHRVGEHRIGLTDLVKHHSGSDASLQPGMFDVAAFDRKIREYRPRFVAFNGKRAAGIYLELGTTRVAFGLQEARIDRTRIFVLPSTSGAANRSWDESHWHELARLIRAQRVPRSVGAARNDVPRQL